MDFGRPLPTSGSRPLDARFNAEGNAAVKPFSAQGLRRVLETVGWGASIADKVRIAAYYALRVTSRGLRRDHDLVGGMYPRYWLGDVTVHSPIGRFACRARTIDFDIVNPNYEAAEVDAFQRRLGQLEASGIVCLDVGAHIGKFSILAGCVLGTRGTVFAFEPEPANFAALQKNITLNGLTNVHAINVACDSRDGIRYLSRSTTNIGAHTLRERERAERIPVQARALDSFLGERGVGRVDLMKLDVEYMEAEVLKGAKSILESSRGMTVLFEETDPSGNAESTRFLRSLGFEVTRLAGNTYSAIGAE